MVRSKKEGARGRKKSKKCPKPEKKKLDIIQIASKKRHLALLEKVNRGTALSSGEIRDLKRFEKKGDSLQEGQVETQDAVARVFNVSIRTVRRWVEEGMPKAEDGSYDLIEIQAWRTLRGSQHKNDKPGEKEQWDVKYRQMKALIAEIQYKKLTGELISKDEVVGVMQNRIVAIKRQFLALPQRVAPQLEGLDIVEREALLTERLKEIIQGFADGRY